MKINVSIKYYLLCIIFLKTIACSSQTFDIYISNRHLVSANSMEFDVFIKNAEHTQPWALRLFQSAYQFNPGFVNGGSLSAAYVAGSSELESSFGKTWGFSYNASQYVLNQSSNTRSVCPGALIGSLPRKIGTFRVINTVSFGCVEDSMQFKLTGSGTLWLSVGRYNSTDCSDAGSTLVTAGANAYTVAENTSLKAELFGLNNSVCDSISFIDVRASGGTAPYTGVGQYACGSGWFEFQIQDTRGCLAKADTLISSPATIETFVYDSSCGYYVFPWGDSTQLSGLFHRRYLSISGCDSMVHYDISILPAIVEKVEKKICPSEFPFFWKGRYYDRPGEYQLSVLQTTGCDSTYYLHLIADSMPATPAAIYGQHAGLCMAGQKTYSIEPDQFATGFWWNLPSGSSLISGQWSTSVNINIQLLSSDAKICVQSLHRCGNSLIKCQPLSNLPADSVTMSGPGNVTKGQRVNYSAMALGASSYSWSVPKGWSILSGQGTAGISVKSGPQSGWLKCTPSNACGQGTTKTRWVSVAANRFLAASEEIVFGPNPAGEMVSIYANTDSYDQVLLMDSKGSRLAQSFLPTEFDLSKKPSGIYYLVFKGNKGRTVRKLLHVSVDGFW